MSSTCPISAISSRVSVFISAARVMVARATPSAAQLKATALPSSGKGHVQAQFAGNKKGLDLAGAVADGADPVVAQVTRGRAVVHEAPAAMDLDRQVGAFAADLGRVIFGDGEVLAGRLAPVGQPGGLVDDHAGGFDLDRHVGDHLLDQ